MGKKSFTPEWMKFLQAIQDARDEIGIEPNMECFYRGHSKRSFTLLPGLFRGLDSTRRTIPDDLWETESDLYFEFRAKAKAVHIGDLSEWDILFYMQHHGVRTRLLDWTENLGIAIYFALYGSNRPDSSPTVWLLNPYRMNKKFHETEDLFAPEYLGYYDDDEESLYSDYLNNEYDLWWKEPIAIYPIRRVERLTTQGGYFTIQGTDIRPLDHIAPTKNNFLRKIEIPKAAHVGAQHFLEHAGINEFSVFPDLDGLARYLNDKFFG